MSSPQELFKALLTHIDWQIEDANFLAGQIDNVTVHTQSRIWQFVFRFPKPLQASLFKIFSQALDEAFAAIARVDIRISCDQAVYSQEELLDYWPIVVKRADISSGLANQVFQGQIPEYRDQFFIIRVENATIQKHIDDSYIGVIKQTYSTLGFDQIQLKTVVDQATADDRQAQFETRKERIADEQAKLAQAAQQQAEKQAKSDQVGPPVQIAIGKTIPADEKLRSMNTYLEEQRYAAMEGVVFEVEVKVLKTGRRILNAKITDYTSAFLVQMFSRNDQDIAIFEAIKPGMWLRVRGDIQMDDRFVRDLVVTARDLQEIKKPARQDTAPDDQKRVEFHLHTNMSMLDATNTISDYVKQAAAWGHQAIAITDHAGVQAYPEASAAAKSNNIEMIYGLEANIVDDGTPIAYNEAHELLSDATYVVFDVETTGLSSVYDKIIEIAGVKMHKGNVIDTFEEFIDPGHPLSRFTTELTGITDAMVAGSRPEAEIMADYAKFCEGCILVAHNASFDMGFINAAYRRHGMDEADNPVIDTLELSRFLHPEFKTHGLGPLSKRYNIKLEQHHRAIYDAETTAVLAWKFIQEAQADHDYHYHDQLNDNLGGKESYKQARPFHMTLYAKNQAGLKAIFKLVSAANVDYFYRVPRLPRSMVKKYRKDLVIGSACANGEVFETLVQKGRSEALDKAKFYDFIEIQPKGVYEPLILDDQIHTENDLEHIMKELVNIGKELDKPVVATGDVHYLNPEDKQYREILIHSIKSNRTKHFPKAHFRTTDEMLADFAFMGEELAYELVVTNSQKVASWFDHVEPIQDRLYPPEIEGAEQEITDYSYKQARAIYGDQLPEIVEKRLEKELTSIIGNGFSVVYLISQKLVLKSNEDGYIVGSRGSVGSSFVATMMGITEVNPLSPHYVCPNCHYAHFFTDGSVGSGFDLPDKPCPECGTQMNKDGQDIPFETFLGFKGDKVPDIDLNFSGDYQARAHDYTKELFGEDYVYRAGTIGTVADKTAFGYVLGYDRDNNLNLRKTEKEYLAKGATGVKRTTGQHPGGIIVIPDYMDVYDFTPIQYPADDQKAEWKTTHFDFHSIDANVLKLDILGHDDPTMIRKLQDLSGISPTDIPVDDPDVYALFNGTEILGVTPDQIYSKTGTLGIPEFGTGFTRQMLEATKPSTFAELLQISGLSHGTDVWLGNAEVLVREHGLPLSEVIGCRDDIMVYLIHQGLDNSDAFQIMEKVRKGKGLSEEHKTIMREHGVPEWYLESCEKIKYMFPKAHAAAYVLNAMRVAWFKVHHPIWYYCAYFSVRANDFDLVAMVNGKSTTKNAIADIQAKGNDATQKDKNVQTVMELANEMLERGMTFKMVDLNKSDAMEFIISEDGQSLIAPFRAIPGLGNNVARQIVKAREEQDFLSKEDLRKRGGVSQTIIDYMTENHVLDHLPDENQLSLFDF
ncbi:DNA polymerase III subunit alpha [Aerococcus urinaehominis]|uniref:DNA polymerase III PolC-type n=1 Tax=Aerococcus urinaehominis TaxID=128944 RepID=A0A109RGR9_9LACT|nr:PolC-type DNA polymerase III [Aerococcus urinaehominis]AMB98826.1 DNA polymerase III subunit alpha [Aerococcus urinaehominis]SDM48724.1 DNA polymerase-3 subunit alpha [Aerococcus urinaehominis]